MKIVTLVKIKFNHLPTSNDKVSVLKVCKNLDPENLRSLVISAAQENGEARALDSLALQSRDHGKMSFDIRFGHGFSSAAYADCEVIPEALEIDGRYFKVEEIKA